MVDFDRLIGRLTEFADNFSETAQVAVTHTPTASVDGYLKPTAGTPVTRYGIVEYKTTEIRSPGGDTKISRARVTFLRDVTVNPDGDTFTLPSGQVGNVVDVKSLARRSGGGFYTIVSLGWDGDSGE